MFFLLLVDCLFLRVRKIRQPDKLDIALFHANHECASCYLGSDDVLV